MKYTKIVACNIAITVDTLDEESLKATIKKLEVALSQPGTSPEEYFKLEDEIIYLKNCLNDLKNQPET